MKSCNILIVGVGGQGTLLASRVLGSYALKAGFDVKLSEVHGMAQRGGSVVTHVRMGERIFSPIIAEGDADILLAFERLEAARYMHFLKPNGVLVASDSMIPPLPVLTGAVKYPDIESILKRFLGFSGFIDAKTLAREAGNERTANVIMLARLAALLGFDMDKFEAAVLDEVPKKAIDENRAAVAIGAKYN